MGYMTNGLSFNTLRDANLHRVGKFKNNLGELAHTKPDGSDWTINDWLTALTGELGEFANVAKKFRRGDYTREQFESFASEELPDIQIYLDLLAYHCGVNLGKATIAKFNKTSRKVGVDIFLDVDDWHYRDPEI